MEHYGKQKGCITRQCSGCKGDLAERYGKQRYCKACHAKHMRKNRPKHSDLKPEARMKANARAYANEYLRRGKIVKTDCIDCGDNNSQMHHPNYSKPLEIQWLCRPCHMQRHT